MTVKNHVLITGTGRCGTIFLVELLTNLGLDTGFSKEDLVSNKSAESNAGLEYDLRYNNAPYIVKSPWFCSYSEEVIKSQEIILDKVFIPMRDINAAAESRRFVVKSSITKLKFTDKIKHFVRPRNFKGGLWLTKSHKKGRQENVLLTQLYNLLLSLSNSNIEIVLMKYPRIVKDSFYLFQKLKPILKGINYESFDDVFNKTVKPDLIHEFNEYDF